MGICLNSIDRQEQSVCEEDSMHVFKVILVMLNIKPNSPRTKNEKKL